MDYVEVGGFKVDQALLERAYSWLSPKFRMLPANYEVKLELFRPYKGASFSCPEEYVYQCFLDPEQVRGFHDAMGIGATSTRANLTPPTVALRNAGFPTVVAWQAPKNPWETDAKIVRWGEGYRGTMTPWLWVKGGARSRRTVALSRAAVMAQHAMDRGLAPSGRISYTTAYDLCETVNSADMYGKESKYATARGYGQAALLLVDGLGEERAGARELDTLSRILTARAENGQPTAIATERDLSAWLRHYYRYDHDKAVALGTTIVTALCCYSRQGSREQLTAELSQRLVDLGEPTIEEEGSF